MLDFREYLLVSEDFASRAADESQEFQRKQAIVIATVFAWTSIESFVNSMLADFEAVRDRFQMHEVAFLEEKRLVFKDSGVAPGSFALEGKEYRRIEHKILFLVARFGRGVNVSGLRKGDSLWQKFERFKAARDSLVHPRDAEYEITVEQLESFVSVAKEIIQILAKEVWNKPVCF